MLAVVSGAAVVSGIVVSGATVILGATVVSVAAVTSAAVVAEVAALHPANENPRAIAIVIITTTIITKFIAFFIC